MAQFSTILNTVIPGSAYILNAGYETPKPSPYVTTSYTQSAKYKKYMLILEEK